MATIYKRGGKQIRNGTWYVQYFDETGRRRTVRGCKDKEATQQIARKLEADAALRKAGVIDAQADRYAKEDQRPIREHLEDWRKDLCSRGVSEKQVRTVYRRAVRVFDLAGVERLSEITAHGVQSALGQLRETGRAAKTLNDILASVKQFCMWARRERRIPENPLDTLRGFNTAIDRRHNRRALTDEELGRIFAAAHNGPTIRDCPGAERALIYRLAVLTGLRANEIRTLTKSSFELDTPLPTVTVEAAFSKHRRKDVQPIPQELVPCLRDHLRPKTEEELAFRMLANPIEGLKQDLAAAGVEYHTKEGYADFHALRHTYITRLVKAGVNSKTAQTLARHQDVSLTLNVYSHVELIDRAAALRLLPKLDLPEEILPTTETEDAA